MSDGPPPRYLDDIVVGETARYGRYEVTRDEVIAFAARYDPQPFHLDDAAAAASPVFGRLSASGWHTAAMAMALIAAHEHASGTVETTLGGIGVDELRWLKPVFPGDVLSVASEVLSVTPSRTKADRGVVRTRYTVLNQNDEPVMTQITIVLMLRRPG